MSTPMVSTATTAPTRRAAPVRVTLVDESDLAAAGLAALLAPYDDRIDLVDNREALRHPELLDVVLYEPLNLSSTAEHLLRDLLSRIAAPTAVFSWAAVEELPTSIARPYLSKNLTASRLVIRLEELACGRLDPAFTFTQTVDEQPPAPEPVPARLSIPATHDASSVLTPRESDIIELIVAGMSNREISEELTLSVNSVKTYIRTAYRKMGVARRTQAMRWALERGIGSQPETLVG